MDAENAVNETETTATQNQQQETTQDTADNLLTQDEVNRIVAERVARERTKFEKKYSNVDVDRYNELLAMEEQTRQSEMEKRGEYEKLLKEQAEKFNQKIETYQQELHSIKVDGTLLQEASNNRAVNPQQVVQLLKNQVKLNEAGEVDVIDERGQVKYKDDGSPYTPQDLVSEFLQTNQHFVQPTPGGSGSGQGVGNQNPVVDNDISKLDMNNPEHRARYAEIMRAKGIRL